MSVDKDGVFNNDLSAAEAERLALLAEELGEAAQAIGKILRHGYASRNPEIADGPTNRDMLERELGDITVALALLTAGGDVSERNTSAYAAVKMRRVVKFLHHQGTTTILRTEKMIEALR